MSLCAGFRAEGVVTSGVREIATVTGDVTGAAEIVREVSGCRGSAQHQPC